jgi:hypothetical protein
MFGAGGLFMKYDIFTGLKMAIPQSWDAFFSVVLSLSFRILAF